jgi:putative transport protein
VHLSSHRAVLRFLVVLLVAIFLPAGAIAAEAGPGFRTDLGIVGGSLDFLGSQVFVLLFLALALGTLLGRVKFGFFTLGSTAATLTAGIAISLWAYLGYGIRYAVPGIVTTIFLNLFMFAVGLKVGPQFFAGLRKDGARSVAIALVVILLDFAMVITGAKMFRLLPGFASGLISGSMTDTAVIGVATGAVESGAYRPPTGISSADVVGNIAAAYAVTFVFSLIGIILLVRYLPQALKIDMKAAAHAAERTYGGGEGRLASSGTDAAYKLKRERVDVRAYSVETSEVIGLSVHEFSSRSDAPVLQLLRGEALVDLNSNPVLERGDVLTVVADVERLVGAAQNRIGPEVTLERARGVDLEVADLVVTRRDLAGLTLQEATERVRKELSPGVERPGRLFHPVALIRNGEQIPCWPGLPVVRGDILRIIGQSARINEVGRLVGATVRATTESDIFTLALGMVVGYIAGSLRVVVGHIPFSLGAPAAVMLAGIALSTLRSRNPLFGGPVSEGARSLLQALGLDVFIAVVAVNSGPSIARAFSGGYFPILLAIGIPAAIIPSLVAWFVGRRMLNLNPSILIGTICGARHSTPALKAAQEESASAIPAVGYAVSYAISSVLVLILGYLALFL